MPNTKSIQRGIELFKHYPNNQYWRLFVDGVMVKKEKGLATFDGREPGCINGMLYGLAFTLSQLNASKLELSMICNIAKKCTENVARFHREVSQGITRAHSHIPSTPFFDVPQDKISLAGLTEFIERYEAASTKGKNKFGHIIGKCGKPHYSPKLPIMDDLVIGNTFRGETMHENTFKSILSATPQEKAQYFLTLHEKNRLNPNIESLVKVTYVAPDNGEVKKKLNELIESYNIAITTASSDEERLQIIARHIQQFELLHPFHDANGRIFANCILNWMLIREGLLPATWEDPNVFDLLSVNEIVVLIKAAQDATQQLMDDHQAEIHGVRFAEIPATDIRLFQAGCQKVSETLEQFASRKSKVRTDDLLANVSSREELEYALQVIKEHQLGNTYTADPDFAQTPLLKRVLWKCEHQATSLASLQTDVESRIDELRTTSSLSK